MHSDSTILETERLVLRKLTEAGVGNLYAAWTEYEGTLWVRRSTDQGGTFAPPVRVAGRGGQAPARGPALAVGAHGVVYLAWTVGEAAAADIHLSTSLDHGRSFMAPQIAHHSGGHADAPKIAVDHAGTVHLVWLLLDSRIVDLSRSSAPTFATLPSLKPFFFNSLRNALRFSNKVGA